jgi:hypothetical protein
MKREDPESYIDIFREFETVKRTVYTDKEDKVKMAIPRATLDDICKKHLKEDFEAVVQCISGNSGHYVVGFMSE